MLLVEGIAGHPIVVQEREGADKALAENPEPQGRPLGQRQLDRQRHQDRRPPGDRHQPGADRRGVDDGLAKAACVAEAFAEAGRPAPLITGSITGDALGYWKANPDKYRFEGHAVLPGWTAQTLFRVGVRILDGQKPKLNTLMIPIPPVARRRSRQVVQGLHDAGRRVGVPGAADRPDAGGMAGRLLRQPGADHGLGLRQGARTPAPRSSR